LIARAVVPVAGLGTRLLPLTRAVPKEMLAIGLGDALRHARSFAGAEAVAVALGDSIIDPPAPWM
jgi:UTP-glucose-1-phosphate uridylyltransferase